MLSGQFFAPAFSLKRFYSPSALRSFSASFSTPTSSAPEIPNVENENEKPSELNSKVEKTALLVVSNLPKKIGRGNLLNLLRPHKPLRDPFVVYNQAAKEFLGKVFVEFPTQEVAGKARQELDGRLFRGQRLKASFLTNKVGRNKKLSAEANELKAPLNPKAQEGGKTGKNKEVKLKTPLLKVDQDTSVQRS